jgi:hypothetical protein
MTIINGLYNNTYTIQTEENGTVVVGHEPKSNFLPIRRACTTTIRMDPSDAYHVAQAILQEVSKLGPTAVTSSKPKT